MRIQILRAALVLSVFFGSGCAPSGPPRPVLVINLGFPGWPPNLADSIASDLVAGRLTLDDLRIRSDVQRSSCTFAADYINSLQQPDFQFNGTPGTSGFNVRFISLALISAGNPASPCPADAVPAGLVLSPDRGIAIGQPIHGINGELHLANQVVFSSNRGFFEFTLGSIDVNSHAARGSFRMLLRNDTNRNDTRAIFASGSFSVPPH